MKWTTVVLAWWLYTPWYGAEQVPIAVLHGPFATQAECEELRQNLSRPTQPCFWQATKYFKQP